MSAFFVSRQAENRQKQLSSVCPIPGKRESPARCWGGFGGVFPVFSRIFVFRLKQIGKSFCCKRKIILMRLKNQSVPNGIFGGLRSFFLPPFFAICMNFTAQNIRAWCSSFLCFLCHGESAVARFCGAYGYGCHRKTVQAFFLYEGQPCVAGVFSFGFPKGGKYSILEPF